ESNSTNGDRYKYTGREWDAAVLLQYNRARYYDPATGRWTSQDPLGFNAGDSNLYRYVKNSTPNHVDPSGLIVPILVKLSGLFFRGGKPAPSPWTGGYFNPYAKGYPYAYDKANPYEPPQIAYSKPDPTLSTV